MPMKKTMSIMLVLSIFVLIVNCNNNFLCSAAADDHQPNPVRDAYGEELREGVRYYVLHTIGFEGGVTLGRPLNTSSSDISNCTYDVVQDRLKDGIPVTFKPAFNSTEEGVIRVSTDLNVRFKIILPFCRIVDLLWNLEYAEEIERYMVGTTSELDKNPGCDTLTSWFKIEEVSVTTSHFVYKFVFCPTVCNSYFCRPICKDVDRYFGPDNVGRLSLTDDESVFPVLFFKASDT